MFTLTESSGRRRIEFGVAWSIVFIPLLFTGAALSFPYGWFLVWRGRRRDRSFVEAMSAAGRCLSWDEFSRKLNNKEGTLIHDFTISGWPGGYSRIWWTPEDLYKRCPYQWVSAIDADAHAHESEYSKAPEWCRLEYTGGDGIAFLVDASVEEQRTLFKRGGPAFQSMPLHELNWVEVSNLPFLPRNLKTNP